jgi:trans-aconitate methyltransferase
MQQLNIFLEFQIVHVVARFAKMTIDQGKVYDLGCGPGHIAAYLKTNGVDVK